MDFYLGTVMVILEVTSLKEKRPSGGYRNGLVCTNEASLKGDGSKFGEE